jgi:hypothetical protein
MLATNEGPFPTRSGHQQIPYEGIGEIEDAYDVVSPLRASSASRPLQQFVCYMKILRTQMIPSLSGPPPVPIGDVVGAPVM